nr:RHS repeat-associated core domain-containing protein [uncultured Vibrio sp.]
MFAFPVLAGSNPFISRHGINFSTGNKFISERDIALPGPVEPLNFSRYYNSQNKENTTFGYGWSFSEHESLQIETGLELIVYTRADGHLLHFTATGTDNQWSNAVGSKALITKTEDGYLLRLPDGRTRQFNFTGQLLSRKDANGNQIDYTYEGQNLKSITDNFGRILSLTYNEDGKVASLTAPIGVFTYAYDANSNLVSVTRPDNKQRTYLYEDTANPHCLTGIVDETDTRVLTATYDTMGRIVTSAFADNREKVSISYQAGFKRVITDSLGAVTTYQLESWNGVGQVKSFTGPGCSSCGSDSASQYTYDMRQQVLSQTDALGVTSTYDYDEQGNRIRETRAVGTAQECTTTTTYTADFAKPATVTEPSAGNSGQNKITTFTYDAVGNQHTRTETGYNAGGAISRTTTTEHDSLGRIVSIDGPRSDVNDITTLVYYDNTPGQGLNRGFLRSVTNAAGHQVLFSDYNNQGLPERITDANGQMTLLTYNSQGRLLERQSGGRVTQYRYNDTGTLIAVILPGNRTLSYTYNAAGKVAKVTDQVGNAVSYGYDSEGRVLRREVLDPEGNLTTALSAEYDEAGRILTLTHPDGSNEQRGYDLAGNLTEWTNGLGQMTAYGYDALNRLSTAAEPASNVSYSYDLQGNLRSVTDAKGRITQYTYDDFGNRVTETSPDTGTVTMRYDTAGNLIEKTDANNITTHSTYDALNRLTGIVYPNSALNVKYTYDAGSNGKGRLTTVSDESGSSSFQYNAFGELTTETATVNGHDFTTNYSYNDNGELTTVEYPSGRTVTYERDAAGNVTALRTAYQGDSGVVAENIARLPFGPLTAMTLGNGLTVASTYDQLYRLASIQAGELMHRTYSYNAISQVTAITDQLATAKSQTVAYDEAGRLLSAQGIYGALSYTYDEAGNRLTSGQDGITSTYTYAQTNNRLQHIQGTDSIDYSYDAAGNPLSKGNQTYSWNQENRLAQIAVDNTVTAQYSYDFRGLRKIAVTTDSATLFLYDPSGNLLAEADARGTILREYVYLDGQRLSAFDYTALPAFAVTVTTSSGAVIEGVQAYAFDEQNQYTNLHAATDVEGKAKFNRDDFGEGAYRFRVDYLGHQLWTEPVTVQTSQGVNLVIEEAQVTVQVPTNDATQAGATVYVFSESGEYLGLSGTIDEEGKVSFTLPEGGNYTFRTELFGQLYSSALTTAAAGASTTIDSGGGVLTVQLADDDNVALEGVTTTLQTSGGTYLGLTRTSDTAGKVTYTVPSGSYLLKAEYLGYPFWSTTLSVTSDTSGNLIIPLSDLTTQVKLQYEEAITPLASVPCTLFTPEGDEQALQQVTDAQGKAVFSVPQKPYRIKATYLTQEYWSADVTWEDASIVIAAGKAVVNATNNGMPLTGATIRVYTAAGTDTAITSLTDSQGQATFILPGGSYRFQAIHEDEAFWSGDLTVTPDQVIHTTISTGGGSYVLSVTDGTSGITGVKTMLFSASGSYLNQSITTSSEGEAAYNLADGTYLVTASYLGYEYSTDLFTVPLVASQTLAIPHQTHTISVFRTYQNDRVPLADIETTLCTVDGSPLSLNATTGTGGTLQWNLPSQTYTVQALYLGRTYLSETFSSDDPTVLIPEGLARVTLLQGGTALANTQVIAISESDPNHPQSLITNVNGVAEFRLPAGSYTFKATLGETVYQGIGTVVADQLTAVTLNLGTSTLLITVRKDETTVLPGVVCSLYTTEGEPLDYSTTTDASGVASFAVAAGTYMVQARYLGYDFTSEVIETPAVLSTNLTIPHRDLAVRVLKDQGEGTEPLSGLRCYLYSMDEGEGLNSTGLYADSDDQGMVHFLVPEERAYYAVTTLLGREFISMDDEEGQTTLTVELGTMTVTVRDDSQVTEANPDGWVQGAMVKLYSMEGTALGQELSTGADGQVCFTLPEGSYKLLVGYNDQQFWSGVISTYPFGDTPVEMLNGSGGLLSRLHDPHPPLWHGAPPQYRPMLALVSGSLAGMLNTAATPVTDTPQVFYYLNDHLGTAQFLVDAAGTVIWQGDAQPFGQVTEVINQIDHRFRFPGQMVDPESGLYYNWHRFYDPSTGRYISADPIGLDGGLNLYAYVQNDPVNWVDPWGLCRENGESKSDCANRVAKEVLGNKLELLDGLGYWGIGTGALSAAVGSSLFANVTDKTATTYIKNAQIAGASTEGNIVSKIAASDKAASKAARVISKKTALATVSKYSGILGAAATGGSATMRALGYYFGECDKECPCK